MNKAIPADKTGDVEERSGNTLSGIDGPAWKRMDGGRIPTMAEPKPKRLYSLDRWPNNDGHYEAGNVRWATQAQQDANKRKRGTCHKQFRQS